MSPIDVVTRAWVDEAAGSEVVRADALVGALSSRMHRSAIDAFLAHRAPDADTGALLHRDLHPLNLLWDDASVVGVVDWTFACIDHPHAELSHCRWNLRVLAGLPVADEFLDHYLAATGSAPYSSWWDLATLLGLPSDEIGHAAYHAVGRDDLDHATIVRATEQMLAAALDRLA